MTTDLTKFAAQNDKTFGFVTKETVIQSVGGSGAARDTAHQWLSGAGESAYALKGSVGKAMLAGSAAALVSPSLGLAAGAAVFLHDVLSGGAPLIGNRQDNGNKGRNA